MNPLFPWQGGKRRLIKELTIPIGFDSNVGTYYEPFLGSGAMFFRINAKNNVLADINEDIILAFKGIDDEDVIKELKFLDYAPTKESFNASKAVFNTLKRSGDTSPLRTALFYHLVYNSFGNIYRESKDGSLNSNYTPRPVKRFALRCINNICKARLYVKDKSITYINDDFRKAVATAKAGDFVYFDPPYVNCNNVYHSSGFTQKDQLELIDLCENLHQKGCFVLYSNANVISIVDAFAAFGPHWKFKGFSLTHYVKTAKELIVSNY